MCYFTTVAVTVAVMFLKFCIRLFVISYAESRLMIEARHPHRTISIASTVLGDSRARASVWYGPQSEKFRSEWAELAEIQRTHLATSDSRGNSTAFLARRLVVYTVLRWYLQCLIASQLLTTRQHISNSSVWWLYLIHHEGQDWVWAH